MFEFVQSLLLGGESSTSSTLEVDSLNIKTQEENIPMETKQAAQVAILAGIATAALSRVLSHIIVYRRETYKATVDQYHAVIAR